MIIKENTNLMNKLIFDTAEKIAKSVNNFYTIRG